jgi:hypothetical protein
MVDHVLRPDWREPFVAAKDVDDSGERSVWNLVAALRDIDLKSWLRSLR